MSRTEDPRREPTRRDWQGYWSMIVQQTQNAFNDKAAQFILVPLGGAVGFAVESWAAIMIALPFILFAPLAGWLSDRFSKRDVMIGSAIAQTVILAWLYFAVRFETMPLALVGFFALAVQSTFFSPAKIGIIKELVGHRRLGFGAGIQQLTGTLALLGGQVAAGVIFDARWAETGRSAETAWGSAAGPMLLLAILSLPAIGLAILVPRTPSHSSEKLTFGLLFRHLDHVRELWGHLGLRRAALAVAFFWGFAAFINLWSVKIAKALTDGQLGFGTLSSWFMAGASLGMVGGFGLASYLMRRRIELGWVPVAGLAMAATSLTLAALDPRGSLELLQIENTGDALRTLVDLRVSGFVWVLAALAFSAALFLAPLNAWLQDNYPPAKRGEMQSAVNLQDCLAGVLAAVAVEAMVPPLRALGFSPLGAYRVELVLVGLSCVLITWFILRLLPSDFIRVLGLSLMSAIYRIRAVHPERVPEEGGVLLLPNHVTWADAFFITAASPRPVRFVMDSVYMKIPAVGAFCRTFHTVPIDMRQPRRALETAADALRAGDVVCLFPEGQLSRTGTLQELKRGFEIIARSAGCPLVPVWLDNAWGSIFSFERGRFFTKLPHRLPWDLRVAFGEPIQPGEASLEKLNDGMRRRSADALLDRAARPGWTRRIPRLRGGHVATEVEGLDPDDPEARRRLWANGRQLSQLNALPRRGPVAILDEDPVPARLGGLATYAALFRARIVPAHREATAHHWIGGETLRERLASGAFPAALDHHRVFFDFSAGAAEPLEVEGWVHCPCLAIEGVIVAMSIPDPPLPMANSKPQPGRKAGSSGLLLPGFYVEENDGHLVVHGPAAPSAGLVLPAASRLDAEGHVFVGGDA